MTIWLGGLLLALLVVFKLAPHTPTAVWLHRHLIERPVAWGTRLERHQVLYFMILATLILLAGQTLATLGSWELITAYTMDLAVYADVMVGGFVAASAMRFRPIMAKVVVWLRMAKRVRPRRRRSVRAAGRGQGKASANDDDGPARYSMLRVA